MKPKRSLFFKGMPGLSPQCIHLTHAQTSASVAATAVLVFCSLCLDARAQLTTGLQAYFDFETSTITNSVADTSGFTPTITNTGTPESGFAGSDSRPSLVGNALNLIRSENDFFTITNIGSGALTPAGGLNLGGTFTLSAWHYLDLPQGTSTGSNRYYLWENAADFDLSWGTSGNTTGPDNYVVYNTTAVARSVSLERNTWNHITQVFSTSGSTITSDLYINGVFVGSNDASLAAMSWSGLRFGNSRSGGGRAWDGTLDEIGIWNTSLTAAQAQEVYIRGLQGTGLTATTTGVGSWNSAAATNAWTTGDNWTAGAAIGATGAGAASSNAVAIFGDYTLANGLGIDMSAGAADGALGVGAIVLDSASGTLRIGNSSADTNGILHLNGATTGAGANTLLYVTGQSDLVIADSPDAANPGTTTLGVTLGVTNGTISVGTDRTVTIESAIGEATAGSGFTKSGNGTLLLSGTNTFTGTTAITAGTVRLGASNSLADTSSLTLSGGSFDLDAFSHSLAAVAITAPASIAGSGTLTTSSLDVSNASGTATISAGLAGGTALTKTGGGLLLLSGTNSQTGATAVDAGTLVLAAPGSLSAGSATSVAAGAALALRLDDGFTITDVSQLLANTLSGVTMDAAAIAGADTAGVDATIADGLSGSRGFAKLGDGTLTLTGANSPAGGTTIAGGTLAIGAGGTSGSLTGNVTNNATLAFNRSDNVTYADVISGSGGVRQDGTGTLTLTGANTHTGGTTIAGGTLDLGGGGTTGSVAGNIDNSGTLVFNRSNELSYAGTISGSGSLVKDAAGTLTLSGLSTFTGDVTISSGTLVNSRQANNANPTASGLGNMTTAGRTVTVEPGATLTFNASDALGSFQYKTPVTMIAAGGTIQNGTSRFMSVGDIELRDGGTLNTQNGANDGFQAFNLRGSITVTGSSGSFITTTGSTRTGIHLGGVTIPATTFDVAATGDPTADLTVSAPLRNEVNAGPGGLIKTGAGRMVLTATSDYSGGTAVNAGTLAANAASALGTGATSVASGATLEIGHASALQGGTLTAATGSSIEFNAGSGTTFTIGGLAGSGNLVATGNTLAIGGNNASTTYSGLLTADALIKQGTGTLTLTESGHTLGSVTVAGGTLVATNAAALGTESITLAGGRLQYAGAGPVTNGIVLTGDAASNSIDAVLAMDYVVVGGGGGGSGRDISGGGGAGGVLSNLTSAAAPLVLTVGGSYGVTVGAGGNGGANAANGANGGSSSIAGTGITALGGGGGGRWNGTPNSGASGGGGGGFGTTAGAAGTAGQGFAGGAADGIGGGGGGAGGPGQNGQSPSGVNKAGDGGVGLVVPIMSGGLATTLAIGEVSDGAVYFGGGGGGSPHRNNTSGQPGLGGLGGGGNAPATNALTPQAGTANTGGGGAASRSDNSARFTGGRGGSGVVVVRYEGAPQGTGGTVTEGTGADAGYTFHTFTTTGTTDLVLSPTRTISGDITGTGGFTFDTPDSTLVLSGSGNTFSGGAIVSDGTLRGAAAGAFGTGVATASGGTLEVAHVNALRDATLDAAGGSVAFTAAGTNTYAIAALSGAGAIDAGGNSLAVGGGNASTTFAGSLTADTLLKQGTGTLTLSGVNTLADTRIEAGSVFAKSATAFGSGTVTLAGGGLRVAPGTAITNAIVLDEDEDSNFLGSAIELDYLVVGGGGGGGGRDASGGGGAGGVLSNLVSAGLSPIIGQVGDTFTVTVGDGGAGGGVSSGGGAVGQGTNGDPSVFATVTALGGGGGGSYNTGGKAGASGGGGGRDQIGGAGTAGEGFAGGNGSGGTNTGATTGDAGGGGGGAAAAGGNGVAGSANGGGRGGNGVAVGFISPSLATALGIGQVSDDSVYFGGGGGGTPHRSSTSVPSGLGGLGGGGAGSVNATNSFPAAGTANTGGGGGASRTDNATRGIGGAGGSGVVVVRYAGEQAFSGGDDIRTEDGFTYHTFKNIGASELQTYLGGDATVTSSISGSGGFTWDSVGTLTLTAANTYTGNTIVDAGTFSLASGGQLRFVPGANGESNKVTGTGSANFDGSFHIILTEADATVGNQWTLVDVESSSFDESFSIVDFEKSGSVHTFVDGGNTWTFDETTGMLALQATVTDGYAAWAAQIQDENQRGPSDDPDGDGLTNLQEFAFGSDPNAATGAITIDANGNVTNGKGTPISYHADNSASQVDFRAVFSRRKDFAEVGLVYTVQFSHDLAAWHDHEYAADEPIVMDDRDAEIEVVYVPFPLAVGNENSGFVKPRFVRIGVSLDD